MWQKPNAIPVCETIKVFHKSFFKQPSENKNKSKVLQYASNCVEPN